MLSRSDLIGAIRDREEVCCGSFECHTLNKPAQRQGQYGATGSFIHYVRTQLCYIPESAGIKKKKRNEIALRLFGRVFVVPCAAPNRSSLALQAGRRSSRGRGRVRKTC